jgi:hypothetical protein
MEKFEGWWKENMPNDMRYESAYHKALLKDGWKAALEWVLGIKIISDSCVELDMLRSKIKQELKS